MSEAAVQHACVPLEIRSGEELDASAYPLWTDDYTDVLSVLRHAPDPNGR